MRQVIRHDDGRLITTAEWATIRNSAVMIAFTHFGRLSTNHLPLSTPITPRKKMFFKCFFLNEWLQAVRALELAAPLLSLCARVWKGDRMLGCVLQDKKLVLLQPPSRPAFCASSVTSSFVCAPSHASTSGHTPPSRASTSGHAPPSCASTSGHAPCYIFTYLTVLTDYHWDCCPFFHHTLLSYAQTMTCRDSY
jgi:hypothetical protein